MRTKVFRGATQAIVDAAIAAEPTFWPAGTRFTTIRRAYQSDLIVQSIPADPAIDFGAAGPWIGIIEIR